MHKGYFDGACNPNPGEMGMGTTIADENGSEIDWACAYKEYGTNNQSEYLSALLLLKRAKSLGVKSIQCFGDSKLVINQINGVFNCNSDELKPLLSKIKECQRHFELVTFEWIPRYKNARADELSKLGVTQKRLQYKGSSNAADETRQPKAEREACEQPDKPVTKSSQLVSEKVKPESASVTIKALKGGRFLIASGSQISVFNAGNMTCSCGSFHRNHRCIHVKTFERLNENDQTVATM